MPVEQAAAGAGAESSAGFPTYLGMEGAVLLGLSRGLELALLANLAKYLNRWLNATDFDASQFVTSTALLYAGRQLVRRIHGKRQQAAALAVLKAHQRGVAAAKVTVRGGIATTLARVDSEAATRALARVLSGRLAETDLRVLRAVDDIYRQAVGRATMQGLAGSLTRRQAAQAALDQLAGRGITGFIDRTGRAWNLASYTEMATRTAIHNAERQGVMDGVRAAGRDLVVVSGSPGSCPLCTPWEGEVLSLDGATPGYPTLSDAERDGLFHPSCRHTLAPYVEGLTRTDDTQAGDPDRYAAEQQQRSLERGIRYWKTREAVAMDEVSAAKARRKVREWQGRLRGHVAEHDLPRLRYREQIGKAI